MVKKHFGGIFDHIHIIFMFYQPIFVLRKQYKMWSRPFHIELQILLIILTKLVTYYLNGWPLI